MCLCRYANSGQSAWPSVETISKKLRISRRQVIRALQVLEGKNVIAIERKNGKGNIYYLLDRKCWVGTSAPESPVTGSHRSYACQSLLPVPPSHTNKTNEKKQNDNNSAFNNKRQNVEKAMEEDIVKIFRIRGRKLADLIAEHGQNKVLFYTKQIKDQYRRISNIKNPGGLLVTALREGWFDHESAEKATGAWESASDAEKEWAITQAKGVLNPAVLQHMPHLVEAEARRILEEKRA